MDNLQRKKRGRPRKNDITKVKPKQVKIKSDLLSELHEEIILRLPITSKDINKKDQTSSCHQNNQPQTEIFSPSSDDETCESESESDISDCENYTCKHCTNKDKQILALTKKIKSLETSSGLIERKTYPLDLDLIHIEGDKINIKEKSDLDCWWCSHPFETKPCFLPLKYSDEKYYVMGNFCSYNCVVAYSFDLRDYKVWERYSFIKDIHSKQTGIDKEIFASPRKEVLSNYSRGISIEEYRSTFFKNDKEYNLLIPPLIPITPLIEEELRDRNHAPTSKKRIALDNRQNLIANSHQLKRRNPLPHQKNTLEQTMGIKVKSKKKDKRKKKI